MQQPCEHAAETVRPLECTLGGVKGGYSQEALREVYYQALLRYFGCNAKTDWLAPIVGDKQALRADFARIDIANLRAVVNTIVRAIRRRRRAHPR